MLSHFTLFPPQTPQSLTKVASFTSMDERCTAHSVHWKQADVRHGSITYLERSDTVLCKKILVWSFFCFFRLRNQLKIKKRWWTYLSSGYVANFAAAWGRFALPVFASLMYSFGQTRLRHFFSGRGWLFHHCLNKYLEGWHYRLLWWGPGELLFIIFHRSFHGFTRVRSYGQFWKLTLLISLFKSYELSLKIATLAVGMWNM